MAGSDSLFLTATSGQEHSPHLRLLPGSFVTGRASASRAQIWPWVMMEDEERCDLGWALASFSKEKFTLI